MSNHNFYKNMILYYIKTGYLCYYIKKSKRKKMKQDGGKCIWSITLNQENREWAKKNV